MIGNPDVVGIDTRQSQRPRPLSVWPDAARAGLVGVMTDIDDTLTRDGVIEPVAMAALLELSAAGIPVIAITGRPAGWSEPFARDWPVAAIVAENGAVALSSAGRGVLDIAFAQDAATRAANALRLHAVARQVLAEVPGARLARDSAGRITDIAVDHAEFARLDAEGIARTVTIMRAAGMTATVSSIHVNGWFGEHSKWSGACWMVRRLFGRDLAAEVGRWVYVGDSTNDQEMFGRFPHSVGVANLQQFAAQLTLWPAWITQGERGAGFSEVARALLATRRETRT